MVAPKKKKKKDKSSKRYQGVAIHVQKYLSTLDKSLPLYVITCLDNIRDSHRAISIAAYHFRDDAEAIAYSEAEAKHKAWKAWEITDKNGTPVYTRDIVLMIKWKR